MLGLDELKQTRFYQEVKEEGWEEGREETLALAIPALLESGLTLEQVAGRLRVDIETARKFAQQSED